MLIKKGLCAIKFDKVSYFYKFGSKEIKFIFNFCDEFRLEGVELTFDLEDERDKAFEEILRAYENGVKVSRLD